MTERRLKLPPRSLPVLRTEEPLDRLPENFVFGISKDALSPCVPTGDAPLFVQTKERIVFHILNKQPKPLFALPQAVLSKLSLGQVPHHLYEAQKVPGFVTKRSHDAARPELTPVFTYVPALVFRAAVTERCFHLLFDLSLHTVLFCEGDSAGGTQNLSLTVAQDALGPFTPARDAVLRVEC